MDSKMKMVEFLYINNLKSITQRVILLVAFLHLGNNNINAQCQACQEFLSSAGCEINVNEPSWGATFNEQKKATFKFFSFTENSNSGSLCTGVLVNSHVIQENMQNYFVTAWHCLNGQDLTRPLKFYFNYQSKNSNSCDVPTTNRGCGNGGQSGYFGNNFIDNEYQYYHESTITLIHKWWFGDMALCRIDNPIPVHFNVYYAGWRTNLYTTDASTFNAIYGPFVGLHHPEGDIKKISRIGYMDPANNLINIGCTVITTVINVINSIFGGNTNSSVVCNYIEAPAFVAQGVADGTFEEGSSGSPLFTNGGRLIGNLSTGLFPACSELDDAEFTKFKNFYRYEEVNNVLNPSNNISVENTGLAGRQRTCYDNLYDLSGQYFPLGDYQSNNHLTLKANDNITTSSTQALNVYPGADYTFEAGNEITFNPGFTIANGAEFNAEINPNLNCDPNTYRVTEDNYAPIKNILSQLPKSKKFDTQKHIDNAPIALKLSPNPVQSTLHVELKSIKPISYTTDIYNSNGLLVYSSAKNNAASFDINTSSFVSGLYVIKIQTKEKSMVSKFVKN